MKSIRIAVAVTMAATVALSAIAGCGDDQLSRDEFIAKMEEGVGSSTANQLTEAGVKREDANKIVKSFASCVYDQIKDDDELMAAAASDEATAAIQKQLESKTSNCASAMQEEMKKVMGAGG